MDNSNQLLNHFTDKMSEANKLQTITLIQSIWDDMCAKISNQEI